jgi:transketolase
VLAPFVTRPPVTVVDRAALGLAPAVDAVTGVYALRRQGGPADGTVVLQGSAVTHVFVTEALPRLDAERLRLNVFSVVSAELFDLLPPSERERVFPEALQRDAVGITGFTLPTLYRWIRSEAGRAQSLHPFRRGGFLGSGQAADLLVEAGLDAPTQLRTVLRYARERSAGA